MFYKFVDKFAKTINKLDPIIKSVCLITSFNLNFIKNIIHKVDGVKYGFLVDDKLDDFNYLKEIGINTIILNKDLVTYKNLNNLTKQFDIYLYTFFNDENTYIKDKEFIQNLENNIGIITDKFEETLVILGG
jgi:hypothetical protein